jgi:hypothetical protein
MQRWIVVGVVAVCLLVGGGGFAYWNYRQNTPSPIWVSIPMKHELTLEQREKIARELEEKIETTETLGTITQDLNLTGKWNLANSVAANAELKKRIFVHTGQMSTPAGQFSSLDVGVEGPRKEGAITKEIIAHLKLDVAKILGIKPPAK